MKIGLAAGHSRITTGPRFWEWERCSATVVQLDLMLRKMGHTVILPPSELYNRGNNQALMGKIRFFNGQSFDLLLELHINAGGGDYSTAIFYEKNGVGSPIGSQAAHHICEYFRVFFPWRTIGAKPPSYFNKTLGFIDKTHWPAVITEVGFKDTPFHRNIMDRPDFPLRHAISIVGAVERLDRRATWP